MPCLFEFQSAMCAFGMVRKSTLITVYQWFDTAVGSIIPFILILTLNGFILFAIQRQEVAR